MVWGDIWLTVVKQTVGENHDGSGQASYREMIDTISLWLGGCSQLEKGVGGVFGISKILLFHLFDS